MSSRWFNLMPLVRAVETFERQAGIEVEVRLRTGGETVLRITDPSGAAPGHQRKFATILQAYEWVKGHVDGTG